MLLISLMILNIINISVALDAVHINIIMNIINIAIDTIDIITHTQIINILNVFDY